MLTLVIMVVLTIGLNALLLIFKNLVNKGYFIVALVIAVTGLSIWSGMMSIALTRLINLF